MTPAPAADRPVLVDDSGVRGRRFRLFGRVVTGLFLLWVAVLIFGAIGLEPLRGLPVIGAFQHRAAPPALPAELRARAAHAPAPLAAVKSATVQAGPGGAKHAANGTRRTSASTTARPVHHVTRHPTTTAGTGHGSHQTVSSGGTTAAGNGSSQSSSSTATSTGTRPGRSTAPGQTATAGSGSNGRGTGSTQRGNSGKPPKQ